MKFVYAILLALVISQSSFAQIPGGYSVSLEALEIPGGVGLHSYAFGTANGKWLVAGGRRDGLHARQPFNAFPESMNNNELFVIDPQTEQVWSSAISSLPASIQEQLQSTNSCYHQKGDTLYIAGGYAYSATAGDHITFPNLLAIPVNDVIEQVIQGSLQTSSFIQLTDSFFAVTGGRMVQEGARLLLVGGHRFDGNYNPMGMPTYTQTYTNAVRSFTPIHNNGAIEIIGEETQTDEFHLHRRDYNLIPYALPNGDDAYYISSGVFQPNVDLPYLYPVEISGSEIIPRTEFSQYLSNYHCPTVSLYDGSATHTLFFGGMSRYYYQNGLMVQDDQVPFTRTISMLTRSTDGNYTESILPVEMPGLKGAGAEFIPNKSLLQSNASVIWMSDFQQDSILLGYIYGGINSSSLNPFNSNQTSSTSADDIIYKVWLTRSNTGVESLPSASNWNSLNVYPNPTTDVIRFKMAWNRSDRAYFYLIDSHGKTVDTGDCDAWKDFNGEIEYQLPSTIPPQQLELVVINSDNRMWSSSFIKQ
jgi:hypothetical protein